jgi:group I intron endonuclease
MQLNSGIYKITNIVTNDCYIGSALNLKKRKSKHFSDLKLNKHFATYLQNSYNKYGIENFQFEVLARCPKEYLLNLEQWFLDSLSPSFNTRKIAKNSLGVKYSEETKQKISKIHKGKKLSDETKSKISESNKGRVFSEEHKLKLSESASKRKSRVLSEEVRKKISDKMKNRTFSEEHKNKLKQSALNRYNP